MNEIHIQVLQKKNRKKYRFCDNCGVKFQWKNDIYRPYDSLYFNTCNDCYQTCSECGGEIGYVSNDKILSHLSCDLCSKEPCLTCGITIHCDKCDVTFCVDCISEEKIDVCDTMKKKLGLAQSFK